MRNKRTIKPLHIESIDELIAQISKYISEENNHEVVKIINNLHHADIASVLDHSTHKLQKAIIVVIQDIIAPETLIWMCAAAKNNLLQTCLHQKVALLIEQLDLEDAIKVLEDYSEEDKELIIHHLTDEKQLDVREGFNYPQGAVGRIMEKNFLIFADNWSVAQAIKSMQQYPIGRDCHAAIIVDKQFRPVGTMAVSKLLHNSEKTWIKDLANDEFKIADIHDDIDELVYFFKQYALAIIPVVNKHKKLVGIVSINNMLYIIEESTESDILNLTGVGEEDTFDTVIKTAKHRFLWLFMNLLIAFTTALVINKFNHTISKIIALASVMPIVSSMGGNAGTQVMTVTVRALSKKNINRSNILRVIIKEIAVCEFNALWLSCIGAMLIMLIYNNWHLSFIFMASVMINFCIAGLFGALVPIALDNMKIDPAAASSVFLTALTDGFGVFTFLGLSYLMM